jgi:hypothetical protein
VARRGEDVLEIIQRYDAAAARRIGDNARRRVLAHHTYAHRAEQLDLLFTGSARTWELGQSLGSETKHRSEAIER